MEEAYELVDRLKNKKTLPMFTSCCPSWVKYLEIYHPNKLNHLSTVKSPIGIQSSIINTYFLKMMNIPKDKIINVVVVPCTAKKYEISRCEEMSASGYQDVDVSLTTRELARMIHQSGINFAELVDEEADSILGEYTGAATIFGVTGGVMEAALRTAYYVLTGGKRANIELDNVRGFNGIKEGALLINGITVKVAVVHGLGNVAYVLDRVRKAKENNEELPYHFIEVMACPGGCIAGGGQPYGVTNEIRTARANGLYQDDRSCAIRYSHENPLVRQLYSEYIESPLSERAHHLFHTKYTALDGSLSDIASCV